MADIEVSAIVLWCFHFSPPCASFLFSSLSPAFVKQNREICFVAAHSSPLRFSYVIALVSLLFFSALSWAFWSLLADALSLSCLFATSGRLTHHMTEADLSLSRVQVLVFDEADRLFELGFAEQLQKVLESTPVSRQCLS